MRLMLSAAVACGCLPAVAIQAQVDRVERGHAFAQANCAACHAIGRDGESPLQSAPPLRTLHRRHPVESLTEALAEGITTGHPAMPEIQLDPEEIGDFIAFLRSLQ